MIKRAYHTENKHKTIDMRSGKIINICENKNGVSYPKLVDSKNIRFCKYVETKNNVSVFVLSHKYADALVKTNVYYYESDKYFDVSLYMPGSFIDFIKKSSAFKFRNHKPHSMTTRSRNANHTYSRPLVPQRASYHIPDGKNHNRSRKKTSNGKHNLDNGKIIPHSENLKELLMIHVDPFIISTDELPPRKKINNVYHIYEFPTETVKSLPEYVPPQQPKVVIPKYDIGNQYNGSDLIPHTKTYIEHGNSDYDNSGYDMFDYYKTYHHNNHDHDLHFHDDIDDASIYSVSDDDAEFIVDGWHGLAY